MDHRRKLVLLVDDDQAVRESLQFSLQLAGLTVHIHRGGAALLADPHLSDAGCLVLDDRNPGMDGFALLRQLEARNIAVPSIMLSSHATPRLCARAIAAGVRRVLEKPLLDNVLHDTIRQVMHRAC